MKRRAWQQRMRSTLSPVTPTHASVWRWTGLTAIAVAVVLFVALFLARPADRPASEERVPLAEVRPPRVTAPAPLADSQSHGPSSPPRAAQPSATDKLCGVSGPDLMRNENESLQQHAARLAQNEIIRWRTGLQQSEDPKQRAMGLVLQNAALKHIPLPLNERDTPSNNELVLLAINSDDPAIYAAALGQCRTSDFQMTVGPCQGLSLEQWAHIDPDNALPWLWIAARARRAQNEAVSNEAMSQAARASRIASYSGEMAAVALDALPRDVSPLEKAVVGAVLTSLYRVETPWELAELCSEEALQRAERKDQCSSIAKLLAAEGSPLSDVVAAQELGRRLVWPNDQSAALDEEQKSWSTYVQSWDDPWGQSHPGHGFECTNLLRYDAFIDQLAAHRSERAAMRATIKLAGAPSP